MISPQPARGNLAQFSGSPVNPGMEDRGRQASPPEQAEMCAPAASGQGRQGGGAAKVIRLTSAKDMAARFR